VEDKQVLQFLESTFMPPPAEPPKALAQEDQTVSLFSFSLSLFSSPLLSSLLFPLNVWRILEDCSGDGDCYGLRGSLAQTAGEDQEDQCQVKPYAS